MCTHNIYTRKHILHMESTHARVNSRRGEYFGENKFYTHIQIHAHKYGESMRTRTNSREGRRFGENDFYIYTNNIYTHRHVHMERVCASTSREHTSQASECVFGRASQCVLVGRVILCVH